MATVDDAGLPVTCAVDIMDSDEKGLYFLTAKGKGFYDRLKKREYIALTGMKGEDTMSCVAVSVRGKVCELGEAYLPRLFEKNPYIIACTAATVNLYVRKMPLFEEDNNVNEVKINIFAFAFSGIFGSRHRRSDRAGAISSHLQGRHTGSRNIEPEMPVSY